jgi:hypothetical protein
MRALIEYIHNLLIERTISELEMAKDIAKQNKWSYERGGKLHSGVEIIFKNEKEDSLIIVVWSPKLEKFVGKIFARRGDHSTRMEANFDNLLMFLKN